MDEKHIEAELKPCPFCGGAAYGTGVVRYHKKHEAWFAGGTRITEAFFCGCLRCGITNKGLAGHQTPALAVEAWNRRATQGSAPADHPVAVTEMVAQPPAGAEPAGSFMTREQAIEFCRKRRPGIEPTEAHIAATIDAYSALFGDLVPAAQQAPAGWVLVPVEPTPEMLKAVRWDEDAFGAKSAWPSDIYTAMLAAAPQQGGGAIVQPGLTEEMRRANDLGQAHGRQQQGGGNAL
jgi:hypothetical protein